MPTPIREARPSVPPLRPVRLGLWQPTVERRDDGTIIIATAKKLDPYPTKLSEPLQHWARMRPDQIFLGERDAAGSWRTLTYAQVLAEAQRIAAALLTRDLSPQRPIAIISGNSIDHALLALAAMSVGIPYAPVSPAYSLMSSDFGKLRMIISQLTPGLVFTTDGAPFAKAIEAVIPADAEVVVARNPLATRPCTLFSELRADAGDAVARAEAKVDAETIGKILFTSGSTGTPKGVINTQRMMCANQAMIAAGFAFVKDEPPVAVDWLPWSHTFGSNHNFNMILVNGGSLYVDDGNPTPAGIAKTARNLREIAPTFYFNVPKGYEALLPFLRADARLRETFFSRLKALFYAGASLNMPTWNELQRLSVEACGERVIFLTSLGSTETAPLSTITSWDTGRPGNIGLPAPEVELKLVPKDGKLEARLRGPNITPGYWRQEELTRAAFDEEGFYKLGDALKFVDPNDPAKGLLFDGRIAEDFKLATGTWVSVGPLRAKFIDHFSPVVRDVVIAGADRDDLAVLIFPDIDACRKLCPDLASDATPAAVLANDQVRAHVADKLNALARQNPGSSTRVCRALLLEQPPSIDSGEMTDKGSINQRAVLRNRETLVEELYKAPYPSRVICIEE